ncbi:VOC family protein [Deinococcus sp. UYEF24]
MITAVTHATRYVPDLDAAVAFYRDLLGFQVVSDIPMNMGPGVSARWLTMSLPGQPDFEVVLQDPRQWMQQGDALAQAQAGMASQPQLILRTDDVFELQARLQAAGVPMPMGDPGDMPWGRDLLFQDPSGSSVYVIQPHPSA